MISSFKPLGRAWIDECIQQDSLQNHGSLSAPLRPDIPLMACDMIIVFVNSKLTESIKDNIFAYNDVKDVGSLSSTTKVAQDKEGKVGYIYFTKDVVEDEAYKIGERILSILADISTSIIVIDTLVSSLYSVESGIGTLLSLSPFAGNSNAPKIKTIAIGNVVNGLAAALLNLSEINRLRNVTVYVTLTDASVSEECIQAIYSVMKSLNIKHDAVTQKRFRSIRQRDSFLLSTELMYT